MEQKLSITQTVILRCVFVFTAFQKLPSSSPRLMRVLEHLTLLSPGDLIPYAEALTASMALLLEPAVPRRILQTLNKLWMGLNSVMPRRSVHRKKISGRNARDNWKHYVLIIDSFVFL